jgi:N-succinyldiaminopimelate aminotransferase
MPKPPVTSPNARQLRQSVFATLAARFKDLAQPPIPLHLGDTYRDPPNGARLEHAIGRLPRLAYQYNNPNGHDGLREAVANRCANEGFPGLTPAHVHVTTGGTGAIATVMQTWLQAGDEVLILAPFWPIVRGVVLAHGGVPVEVPFYADVRAGRSIAEILTPYVTDRTVALYVTSPNNPCGTVLTPGQTSDLAAFCVLHDLWVLADEAYHHYTYGESQHTWIATLPGMAERTATVFTVSKSYALAGLRVGFLVGDPAWLDSARRVSTHSVYTVPLVCQLAALGAIETGDAWIQETRGLYAAAAELTERKLQARFLPAQGGGYVFPDLADDLRGRPLMDWLFELLTDGVSLSPGDAFGHAFGTQVRVCFTAVPLDQVELAIDRLNRALERLRASHVSKIAPVLAAS